MPLNMSDFGKRLSAARHKRGVSQSELARLSGVGQNQISNLEAGKKPSVRADTVVRLCEALRVTTDSLLGGNGEPPHPEPQAYRQDATALPSRRPRTRTTAPVA